MLVCARRSRREIWPKPPGFYAETLGLRRAYADQRRGIYFEAGGGTLLNVYERELSPPAQSVATFLVDDLAARMKELRGRGVVFEEYDEPELKTRDGMYTDGTGFKAAWFKDPDGNIVGMEQLPVSATF